MAQQTELIHIAVMNDADFAAMRSAEGKDTVLIAQKMQEDRPEVRSRLKRTALSCGASFYSKKGLMLQDTQEDITTLIYYICLGIFLILSGMTMSAIKVWSEIPLLEGKYSFLKKVGMGDRDIRGNMKSELSLSMRIPFWLSAVAGGAAAVYIVHGADMRVLGLFAFLVLVQALYIVGIRNYGYRLAGKTL